MPYKTCVCLTAINRRLNSMHIIHSTVEKFTVYYIIIENKVFLCILYGLLKTQSFLFFTSAADCFT